MIDKLIELIQNGGKQSGAVYDGFYELDIYEDGQSFTIKFGFETTYQPSEVALSDEVGREMVIPESNDIKLTSIDECWINDDNSTMLHPTLEQEDLIIKLIGETI